MQTFTRAGIAMDCIFQSSNRSIFHDSHLFDVFRVRIFSSRTPNTTEIMENSQQDDTEDLVQFCNGDICTLTEAAQAVSIRGVFGDDDIIAKDEGDTAASTPQRKELKVEQKKKSNNKGTSSVLAKINSQQDLDRFKESSDVLIVEFVTSWCGACKGIAPRLEELATSHAESVVVVQVHCDSKNKETKKLVSSMGVTSYPVFVVYSQGIQVQKWDGADVGKLEGVFEKYPGGRSDKGRKKKGRR
jgi:thioredoxin 1